MLVRSRYWVWVLLAFTLAGTLFAQRAKTKKADAAKPAEPGKLTITSPAFKEGEMIPRQYTCVGVGISPAIDWGALAENVETLAIIMDDPDAPGGKPFVHWVIFNIPSDLGGLPEKVPGEAKLQNGAEQGFNDYGVTGYRGPCPPGGTHRYTFHVYALDTSILLLGKVNKTTLLEAMKGHIVAEGTLTGKFIKIQ